MQTQLVADPEVNSYPKNIPVYFKRVALDKACNKKYGHFWLGPIVDFSHERTVYIFYNIRLKSFWVRQTANEPGKIINFASSMAFPHSDLAVRHRSLSKSRREILILSSKTVFGTMLCSRSRLFNGIRIVCSINPLHILWSHCYKTVWNKFLNNLFYGVIIINTDIRYQIHFVAPYCTLWRPPDPSLRVTR